MMDTWDTSFLEGACGDMEYKFVPVPLIHNPLTSMTEQPLNFGGVLHVEGEQLGVEMIEETGEWSLEESTNSFSDCMNNQL